MARVGIDLDGVCYNFENSVRQYLVDKRGHDAASLPDPIGWNIDEQWGMTRQQFKDHCHKGVNWGIIFGVGAPYPGTVEGFAQLRAAGHSIHIVTARSYGNPGMSALNTQEWLDDYGLEFDTITYSHDKTIVNVDVMIDDRAENLIDLRNAGMTAVAMDRPWNRNRTDLDGILRVQSLVEFATLVDTLTESPAA